MKNVIVYYTRTGKSKIIAEILSEILDNIDLFEIKEIDFLRRKGILGFIRTGIDCLIKRKSCLKKIPDIESYSNIIVVGPVWANKLCLPLLDCLNELAEQLKQKRIFVLTTSMKYTELKNEFLKKFNIIKYYNLVKVPVKKEKVKNKYITVFNKLKTEID
jgi:menaquinone-dependent protoporphyrinogen IX oxidase